MNSDYQRYLKSRHWQKTRLKILNLIKTCVLCDSHQRLEVHHRHYRTLGCESVEDVTVLCHTCHTRYHQYLQSMKRRENKWKKPRPKRIINKHHQSLNIWVVTLSLFFL